jgi:isocitrate dehydrogenase (NAD+)
VGGLGLVGSANLGIDYAVFEAVHGSAPDIAGKDLANPTALLMSAIMMLDHFGQDGPAARIRAALDATYAAGIRTKDLGGAAGTRAFTSAIIDRI